MKYIYQNAYFSATYGTCAYGQGAYQNTNTTCDGSPSTGSSSDSLVNTGLAVSVILVLVSVIILASLFVRFWRRNKKPKTTLNQN